MNDKRRRARVQGGWAPLVNVRSDRNKDKPANVPNWMGRNIDQPSPKKFVYEQPAEVHRKIGISPGSYMMKLVTLCDLQAQKRKAVATTHKAKNRRMLLKQKRRNYKANSHSLETHRDKEIRQKPSDKVISKHGVYDISTEPSGLSRLRFFPEFFDPKDADQMYDELYHRLPWRQRSDVKNGEKYLQPRLTAWYGDHPYSYSGITHEACAEWHPTLLRIKNLLEEATGLEFNSMLANLYRDGHDSLAWHSDDEKSLGPTPTIASISFGDTRTFQMRKKPPASENGDYTFMQHIDLPLTHGSLLIMEGSTQDDWQHRIPREYHDRSGRINLTFRVIFPEL